jgi:hypothetical protein
MRFSRDNSGRNLKNPESASIELSPRASPQPGRRGGQLLAEEADVIHGHDSGMLQLPADLRLLDERRSTSGGPPASPAAP